MAGLARAQKGLILPASGGGLAYAERTTDHAAIAAGGGDITGLAISYVPDSTQALVHLCLPWLLKDATANYVQPAIGYGAGAVAQVLLSMIASGHDNAQIFYLQTGLTPGTAVAVKGSISSTGGGSVTVKGSSVIRPFITAYRA